MGLYQVRFIIFSMTDRLAFLCIERRQYMAYRLSVYSKENFQLFGAGASCLTVAWSTGVQLFVVFFFIGRPGISIVRQLTESVSPSF